MSIIPVQQSMRNNHSISAWPLLVAALLSGLLLTACGDGGTEVSPEDTDTEDSEAEDSAAEDDDDGAEGADGDAETDLTIVITLNPETEELPDEEREPAEWTLTCGPEGGDHPDAEAACADLEEVDLEEIETVDSEQACTMIHGGNAEAAVTGHVGGTEVDLAFDRTDGCEIDRWDSMGAVLEG